MYGPVGPGATLMLSRFLTEENHIIPSKICVRKENERNLQALKRRIHVPTPLFTTELCQLWKLFLSFGFGVHDLKISSQYNK